jgi:hypothetical protein
MATPTIPVETETLGPQLLVPTPRHVPIGSPLGWGSIFAAAAVALGTWLVLHLLGIGIGLTSIDPEDASSLKGVGIGTGVWSLIAPLIALFVGGLVAGRMAPTVNTWNAIIHAAAAWALTAIAMMMMLGMILGALGRAASSTASTVADAASGAGAQVGQVAPALGLDSGDLVARLNKKLEARGMPRVTEDQITGVVRDVAQTAVRGGTVDRQGVIDTITKRTQLNQEQAGELADDIQREALRIQNQGRQVASQVGEQALEVAEATGKVVLGLSITMLLALGAAALGAILTVTRERRELLRATRDR